MSHVLGVDGGNTKTIALVARLDGTIVGLGRGGCGDIYGEASTEGAIANTRGAIAAALSAAGVEQSSLAAACFSMAGADWPEDFDFLRGAFGDIAPVIAVYNDAMGALRAGTPDGIGVVVACGTGTATGARGPDGRIWHSSFWQDTHGGHDISMKALRAVYRSALGINPPTRLTDRVLEHFGMRSPEALLHQFSARGIEPPSIGVIAAFARVVLDEAERDLIAREIVESHGSALGDFALAAARQVGIVSTPFTLVLTGGVFRHQGRVLADALIKRVHADAPRAQPVFSRFEPAIGALLLALEGAGAAEDGPLLERVAATMPPPAVFET